ncbi:MAG: VWA domain-containing protein [Candidatus Lokiarchaeota archaeon]|nr:VWA domain-containing protein [Candidatus Lokiarchaeota archaeon]
MFKKTSISSEEFIFYIDLTTDFIKKKNFIKNIGSFIKEKDKFNTLSSYGLLLFQSDDNPVTLYDKTDFNAITEIITEKWDTREIKRSFFENGLFEILAYVFRRSRDARKNYRIIIISDTPSTLSEDYHNALYDLLIKAKKFDTFIDIIRVGEEQFYNDDVKLKVVTSETHGGVLYCNDAKSFFNILMSLVQSKSEFNVVHPEASSQILKEDKIFYEKLAVDLISLDPDEEEKCDICEKEVCPICSAYSDEVHKCFNCNVRYHACCAADYSINNNIGFHHIFRCLNCQTLLKLDEEYVDMIYEEEYEEEPEIEIVSHGSVEEKIEEEYIEESEFEEQVFEQDHEHVVIGEDILNPEKLKSPPSLSKPPTLVTPTKKVRVGGYFGQEIAVKPNGSGNNFISPTTESVMGDTEGSTKTEEKISITTLRPPRRSTVKLCKMCGQTLIGASTCPKCGFKN